MYCYRKSRNEREADIFTDLPKYLPPNPLSQPRKSFSVLSLFARARNREREEAANTEFVPRINRLLLTGSPSPVKKITRVYIHIIHAISYTWQLTA